MIKWLKPSLAIFISLVILILIGGAILYRMLLSSVPDYDGEIESNKIKNNIEIYRDSTGIPYILAQDEDDAVFALGYLHAQERLFQMDLVRRSAEGKLSEILGEETIPFDKMFLTVGIKKISENIYNNSDEKLKKLLISYSNGVNQFINEKNKKLPIEFDVLNYEPEEWKPVHSIMIMRMMAWILNLSWWVDISYTNLVQKLGEEKARELLPNYEENAPTIIPSEIKNYQTLSASFINTDRNFRKFIGFVGNHIGSNNWVVNGEKSVTGKPIIANDPHLANQAPTYWYAAVIRSNNLNVEGATLPGTPFVVIGKNKNISWTLTNVMADDADFYVEEIDETKKKYSLNGEWKNLIIKKDTIKIRDKEPQIIEIKSTHRGPIISDVHTFNLLFPDTKTADVSISMRWVGAEVTKDAYGIYLVNRAENWEEFKTGVSYFKVPGQNFTYADNKGNIGYICAAYLPIRENVSSTFVYDGSTDKYDWKGFVPFAEMPKLFNPPQNFIASANNKTVRDFKYHISNLWEPPSRIIRINELLTKKEKHSVADYMKYQNDFVSPFARELKIYLLDAFKDVKVKDKNLETTLELLRTWDGNFSPQNQTPTIFSFFFMNFLRNTLLDDLGQELFNEYCFTANVPYRVMMRLTKENNVTIFDDIKTPEIETRDFIIRKSLVEALSELEKKYGTEIALWQWGRTHKGSFKHFFGGNSKLIDNIVNIGPFEIGGNGTTVFNTEYTFYEYDGPLKKLKTNKFENILGPSMRFIYDFSKPNEFYFILPTGQSGNIFSKHYSDQHKLWLEGKYLKVRTDLESIKQNKYLLRIIAKH